MGLEALVEEQPARNQEREGDQEQGVDLFELRIQPHVFNVLHDQIVEDDDAQALEDGAAPVEAGVAEAQGDAQQEEGSRGQGQGGTAADLHGRLEAQLRGLRRGAGHPRWRSQQLD